MTRRSAIDRVDWGSAGLGCRGDGIRCPGGQFHWPNDRATDSYHRSYACVQPSNGRHTRRGRILVDPVCRCLARRRSNPSLQDAYCENDRRRHCARPRWRASHHCYSLGSFRLTILYVPIPSRTPQFAGMRRLPRAMNRQTDQSAPKTQPVITLWTVATIGSFSPTPNSVRIGISVGPNASKSAWDSQMSKTWIAPFDSSAQW
jgi:hypothetical protein